MVGNDLVCARHGDNDNLLTICPSHPRPLLHDEGIHANLILPASDLHSEALTITRSDPVSTTLAAKRMWAGVVLDPISSDNVPFVVMVVLPRKM